jgi:hypothetical protein
VLLLLRLHPQLPGGEAVRLLQDGGDPENLAGLFGALLCGSAPFRHESPNPKSYADPTIALWYSGCFALG